MPEIVKELPFSIEEARFYQEQQNTTRRIDTFMRFKNWLENDINTKRMDAFPASAEVIRTGLQPQVGSEDITTDQKEENDRLMALDAQIERLRHLATQADHPSEKLKKAYELCNRFVDEWDQLKRQDSQVGQVPAGFQADQRMVDYMRNNQPPPEHPQAGQKKNAFSY
jgi:hypothetical protein